MICTHYCLRLQKSVELIKLAGREPIFELAYLRLVTRCLCDLLGLTDGCLISVLALDLIEALQEVLYLILVLQDPLLLPLGELEIRRVHNLLG